MKKNRRKFTQCPNCGYTFEDVNNFCPNCGQENHDLNVPVKHLLWEFLEGTLHYDTKFWVTLQYLLFRPGLLTEKFNIGQRASYVPPFRLYVFVSLVFFFVLSLRASRETEPREEDLPPIEVPAIPEVRIGDSLLYARDATVITPERTPAAADSAVQNIENPTFKMGMEKLVSFSKGGEVSRQKLLKNISFMMFILMPFFGYILYLFYYRQRRNYVEHLMFSVHFHTFFFLLTILALGVEFIYSGFDVDMWVFWISMLYLYFALHQVYKGSYLGTFLKLIPIAFVYFFSLTLFFLGTLAISVLMS